MVFVTGSIKVYWKVGSAPIVDQDFAIPPGMVLKGRDVVLKILNLFVFSDEGFFTPLILQLQRCLIIQDLIQALAEPSLQ